MATGKIVLCMHLTTESICNHYKCSLKVRAGPIAACSFTNGFIMTSAITRIIILMLELKASDLSKIFSVLFLRVFRLS